MFRIGNIITLALCVTVCDVLHSGSCPDEPCADDRKLAATLGVGLTGAEHVAGPGRQFMAGCRAGCERFVRREEVAGSGGDQQAQATTDSNAAGTVAPSGEYIVVLQKGLLRRVAVAGGESRLLWPDEVTDFSVCSDGLVVFSSISEYRYQADLIVIDVAVPEKPLMVLQRTGYNPVIAPNCSWLGYAVPLARFDRKGIEGVLANSDLDTPLMPDEIIREGTPPKDSIVVVRSLSHLSAGASGQPGVVQAPSERRIGTTTGEHAVLERWSFDSAQLVYRSCTFAQYDPCPKAFSWWTPEGPVQERPAGYEADLKDGTVLIRVGGAFSMQTRGGHVPSLPARLLNVAIAPRGDRIAFTSLDEAAGWKYVVQVWDVGARSAKTVDTGDSVNRLEWNHDGTALIYEKGDELWMVRTLDGASPVKVTVGSMPVGFVDGGRILLLAG